MRRRRIIMFFAMIMSIAIIGVGFAAWIITAPTAEQVVSDGKITVDTVEKHGWKFAYDWVDTDDANIVFGYPEESNLPGAWLSYDEELGVEKLTATLNVKAVKQDDASELGMSQNDGVVAYVKFELINSTEGVDYSKYFTYTVKVAGDVKNELTAAQLLDETGVNVTVEFKWATDEDGTNPFTYFNGMTCNEENIEKAFDFLNGLSGATENLGFKITLTTEKAD